MTEQRVVSSKELVSRLRALHEKAMKGEPALVGSALQEAADKIERLHARVKFLQEWKDACEATIERERRASSEPSALQPPYKAMFEAAVRTLAEITRHLNIPDEIAQVSTGAADIIAAIDELRAAQPPATALGVAPIARIEIIGGEVSQTEVYAPGLPDGAHELFPVPLNPAGELRPFLSSSLPPAHGESIAVWIDANDKFQWDFELNGDHPPGSAIVHAPRLAVIGNEPGQ